MLRTEIQRIIEHDSSPQEKAVLILEYLDAVGTGLRSSGWLEDDPLLRQALLTDTRSGPPNPDRGTKGFYGLRIGNSLEEQIQLNQLAMRLLKSWNEKYSEENIESEATFKLFQEIVDSHRLPKQNVFFKEL